MSEMRVRAFALGLENRRVPSQHEQVGESEEERQVSDEEGKPHPLAEAPSLDVLGVLANQPRGGRRKQSRGSAHILKHSPKFLAISGDVRYQVFLDYFFNYFHRVQQ